MPNDSFCTLYCCLLTNIHMWLPNILPSYFSKWNFQSHNIKTLVKIHWHIQSYFFLFPLFLSIYIELTIINTFSACLIDFPVGRFKLGMSCAALTSRSAGHSGSSTLSSGSMSDSNSATQSSSQWLLWCKMQFQSRQFLWPEMFPGALSSSLSTRWCLILRIRQLVNIGVLPPGRLFADTAGRKGDLSDNLNAATPSCWEPDKDTMTIFSVSEM